MKVLLLLAALFAPQAHASEPLDVQLDNPAYTSVVKNYLDSKRAQYRFVPAVADHSYLKLSIVTDLEHGADCKLSVTAKIGGMNTSSTYSKSSSFVFKDARDAYCKKFVAESLEQALGFVL